jgi:hypothetical protein
MGVIADGGDRRQNVGEPDALLVPANSGTPRGVVDVHRGDPGEPREMLLVEPDARRAGDPFEDQRRFPFAAAGGAVAASVASGRKNAHEALLEIRVIVDLQAGDQRRQHLARRIRQLVAVMVIVGQAIGDDRLRHRLAAATAHGTRLTVDADFKIDTSRHGLTAMVAIAVVHHCQEK